MSVKRAPKLTKKQVHDLAWLAEVRAKDGESIPSTMSLTVYTEPKVPQHCDACDRGAKYFDGCSLLICPQRARIAARPWGSKS